MTVPPMIELAHSAPAFWRWFINLTWVRFVTRRPAPGVSDPEEVGTLDAEFIDEKKEIETIDDESSFVDELPLLSKTREPDHSDKITEHGQSQFSHPVPPSFYVHPQFSSHHLSFVCQSKCRLIVSVKSTDTLLDNRS